MVIMLHDTELTYCFLIWFIFEKSQITKKAQVLLFSANNRRAEIPKVINH